MHASARSHRAALVPVRPLGLEHGSWSAAFQVLVSGVMQGTLGIAQHHLSAGRIGRRTLLAHLRAA